MKYVHICESDRLLHLFDESETYTQSKDFIEGGLKLIEITVSAILNMVGDLLNFQHSLYETF